MFKEILNKIWCYITKQKRVHRCDALADFYTNILHDISKKYYGNDEYFDNCTLRILYNLDSGDEIKQTNHGNLDDILNMLSILAKHYHDAHKFVCCFYGEHCGNVKYVILSIKFNNKETYFKELYL